MYIYIYILYYIYNILNMYVLLDKYAQCVCVI